MKSHKYAEVESRHMGRRVPVHFGVTCHIGFKPTNFGRRTQGVPLCQPSERGFERVEFARSFFTLDGKIFPSFFPRSPTEGGLGRFCGLGVERDTVEEKDDEWIEGVIHMCVERRLERRGRGGEQRRGVGVSLVEINRDVERVPDDLAGGRILDDG